MPGPHPLLPSGAVGIGIRPALPGEIESVVAIDDDASALYAEVGLTIAFDTAHPFVRAERERWQQAIAAGRLRVAVTGDGTLVGFVALGQVDGEPYLDQLSVRSQWGRKGIGGRLLGDAVAWAATSNARLWLTTYAHVPWNRPFYERAGFRVVEEALCGTELRAILKGQRLVLPDPAERIAMVRGA